MADSKIDPYDLGALERSVNDSATRVSGIWLSFVAFSAYLAAAASNISHRQIFLEEPIKLPTINIDLPLVASAILLPLLFVIYHVFVLLQVVLLARTADAYNQALDRAVAENDGRTVVRQRLANTLFAQLFAGSPREREGALGLLLRLMAWITLAIAPTFVLILFEIKLLPFHSAAISWTHRGLIAIDLLAVLFLWAGAIAPGNDIRWQSLRPHWKQSLGAVLILLVCCVFVTFPGEPSRGWMRLFINAEEFSIDHLVCRLPPKLDLVIRPGFDRLVLTGEDFVDDEKLAKIAKAAADNGLKPFASERTHSFRGRDLRCGRFAGADLRRSDFVDADLTGALLRGAHLGGSIFSGARLDRAFLEGALIQESWFGPALLPDGTRRAAARMPDVFLNNAQLQGSNLEEVDFGESWLESTQLAETNLTKAKLSNAQIPSIVLRGAILAGTELKQRSLDGMDLAGANLQGAQLQKADLRGTKLQGANLTGAQLQEAKLSDANLRGASLASAGLEGAGLENAQLTGASFQDAHLQGAKLPQADVQGALFVRARLAGADFSDANVQGATFENVLLYGASLERADLGLAFFGGVWAQGANLVGARLQGAFLQEVRLQGAKLDRSEFAGATLDHVFLWRAPLSPAQDCARMTIREPVLDAVWDITRWGRSGAGRNRTEMGPGIIDRILRDEMDYAPAEARDNVRTNLSALLEPETEAALQANTQAWQQCAGAPPPAASIDAAWAVYQTTLAGFLLKLVCADGPDQKYVAEAVLQYRIKVGSPLTRETFARAFVGLDDKACPAFAQIEDKTKAAIRALLLPKKTAG